MTNRSIATAPTSCTVDSLNQVTSSGTAAYTYDDNGNMLTAGPNTSYEYDDENQLTAVEFIDPNSDNGWRSEFIYDGKLRMRLHLTYSRYVIAGTTYWSLYSDRRMVYDGMLAVQDRNGSNVPTVTYTRGPDLSGTLDGAGGIGGMLGRSHDYSTVTGAWASHNHYHADGNGNITYIVNSSQGLAGLYRYDPFGNSRGVLGSVGNANLYRFSSKMYVATHALYYYGYRFYNPGLQRWMNKDPIGEAGGLNLYAFVESDPIGSYDAYGLKMTPNPFIKPPPKAIFPSPWARFKVCRVACIAQYRADGLYCKGSLRRRPGKIGTCLYYGGGNLIDYLGCRLIAESRYKACLQGCAVGSLF